MQPPLVLEHPIIPHCHHLHTDHYVTATHIYACCSYVLKHVTPINHIKLIYHPLNEKLIKNFILLGTKFYSLDIRVIVDFHFICKY